MTESIELRGFRGRLLNINSALAKARTGYGSVAQLMDMEKLAYPHVQWYSEQGRQSLKHFMMNLDAEQKISEDTGLNKLIYSGIHSIMETVVTQIAEKIPELTGKLVKMGSAYNHMKINQLDEFDFTFELDIEKLLKKNARIKKVTSDRDRLLVLVDFEGEHPDVTEFDIVGCPNDPQLDMLLSINGSKDAKRYKSMLSEHGDVYMFHTEAVAFAMFNILDSVVSNLDLPANWSHGGYNYPNYSGIRLNIPAFLMQFAYQSSKTETPLLISVDFAPVLKLPDNLRYQSRDLVDEFLDECGYMEYQWQRLELSTMKGGYSSLAEEKWLSTYTPDSVPKMVVRICKALHNMAKLTTPKYLSKATASRIADHRRLEVDNGKTDQQMNDCMMAEVSIKTGPLKSDTDYATLLDIHEVVGGHNYVPSYIFKRIVMTMMVMDESQGRKWTFNDVPDLVVSVYMIINDLIMSVNQATLVPEPTQQTEDPSSVTFNILPRSDVIKGRQRPQTIEPLEIELGHLQDKCEDRDIYLRSQAESGLKKALQWYFRLHEAIKKGMCICTAQLFLRDQFSLMAKEKGLDDGIARVLDLLQCVAAGQSKALIYIHRYTSQDAINFEDYLITRKELETLLTKDTS